MSDVRNVTILGSGPAGLTAGVYTARANLKPLIFHGEQPGGQLTTTTDVENFPGFPEGVGGQDLLDNMTKQAERFGAEVKWGKVTDIDVTQRPFVIKTDMGDEIKTKTLIISTGAKSRHLGLPSEDQFFAKGVSTCATCDGFFYTDKEVAVVGGGDSACEEANFLTRFANKVTLIVRRRELRASHIMQERVKNNPKIEIEWGCKPVEFVGDDKGLTGVKLHVDDGSEKLINVHGCFLAIGHVPTTSFLPEQIKLDREGYIQRADGWSMQTSVPGVFACGDVTDTKFKQAITAAGTGCMAALEAQKFLEESE